MDEFSTESSPVLPGCLIIALVMFTLMLVTVVVLAVFLIIGAVQPVEPVETVAQSVEPTPPPVTLRADGPPDGADYRWVEVASGFDNPLQVAHAGDGSGRIFGVEQLGRVWVIENGQQRPTPLLDISDLLPAEVFQGVYTERGLLSIAFHPDFANNGYLFVHHSDVNGDSVVARYRVNRFNANMVDMSSRVELLFVEQPWYDHNGGNLAFGPDGYLYIGFGDGGNVNEPDYDAQDPQSMLGKLLRIDVDSGEPYAIPPDNPFVDTPGVLPEIWALGLRNPWRYSFDSATGDLYLADVGQWEIEEIDFQPADSPGGENYGWSGWEGTKRHQEDVTPELGTLVFPIWEYRHDAGCSITGGYVYRGPSMPELHGIYFFGDYCNGRMWSAYRDSDGQWQVNVFMDATGAIITSFGEDEQGELYMVDYKGAIFRLERAG